MTLGTLPFQASGRGRDAADVMDLQAEQVPDTMWKEHPRDPAGQGVLARYVRQTCLEHHVAQHAMC